MFISIIYQHLISKLRLVIVGRHFPLINCYHLSLCLPRYHRDDRAAIVTNGDVLGDTSLLQLFQHDFWGQNITQVRMKQAPANPYAYIHLYMHTCIHSSHINQKYTNHIQHTKTNTHTRTYIHNMNPSHLSISFALHIKTGG